MRKRINVPLLFVTLLLVVGMGEFANLYHAESAHAQGGGQSLSDGSLGCFFKNGAATANIATTAGAVSCPTGSTGGDYQAICEVDTTVAAGTSSTLPSCKVNYTDKDTAVSESIIISATSAANALGTIGAQTPTLISVAPATAITVSTASYASSGSPAMSYSVRFKARGPF